MSIINDLQWRYATKKFDTNKQLTIAQLQTIKTAFNLTALSYGLQTLKLVVVKNKATRNAILPAAYGQKQVVDASHLLVICIQNTITVADIDTHFNTIMAIRQTPEAVLAPFKTQLTKIVEGMTDAKKTTWATNQAYIALGNLMTVCAAEKIDCCPMEGFIPAEIDKILQLNDLGLQSVLLLPVGFRAEDDMFATLAKVRKPETDTIIEL